MKISIIGSGNMGRSLGILWAEQGHQVFFGSRSEEKGKATADFAKNGTSGGTNEEAAVFGDVLLYTARGIHPKEIFTSTEVLSDKIIIDLNNFEIPEGFNYLPIEKSLAEQLSEEVPNAHVVKAFNTIPQEVFELAPEPLKDYKVSVLVAGDDEEAKKIVMQLAQEIGFNPIDSGNLRNARLIEGLANLERFLAIHQQMGAYTVPSFNVLPPAQKQRLGGRQASSLK